MASSASNEPNETDPIRGQKPPPVTLWSHVRAFCSYMASCITVEPAAFLYFIGYISSSTTMEQYVFFRYSQMHRIDKTLHPLKTCMPSINESEALVQEIIAGETAEFLVLFNLVDQVPPIAIALIMGAYTDKTGRKVALVSPVVGGVLRALVTLLVIQFNFSLDYLFFGAAMEGLSGGSATYSMALFAYVADVSSHKQRSIRIFIVQLVNTLGIAIAQIAIGYMIFYVDFVYPFLLILVIYMMCFFLVIALRESVSSPTSSRLFTWQHILHTIRLFLPHGSPAAWVLRLCLLLVLFDSMVEAGGLNVLLLYLISWPVCFSSILIGFYLALLWSLTSLGSLVSLKLLIARLGDTGLMLIGCAMGGAMRIWLAIPVYQAAYIFVSPVIGYMSSLVSPLTRAVMSKNVSVNDQGAVSAAVSLTAQLSGFLGSLFTNWVYAQTAFLFSGTAFVVCAMLYGLAFICVVLIHRRLMSQKKMALSKQDSAALPPAPPPTPTGYESATLPTMEALPSKPP